MRTTDTLEPIVATGGDRTTTTLHLSSALRIGDHAADLTAALAAGRGTLDGSLTSIRVGDHGVAVSHCVAGVQPVGSP